LYAGKIVLEPSGKESLEKCGTATDKALVFRNFLLDVCIAEFYEDEN
jgi:hypothetical protein